MRKAVRTALATHEANAAQLQELLADGRSRNAAIRDAIDVAYQRHRLAQMEVESTALLHNENDRAELDAARSAMGAGDAW